MLNLAVHMVTTTVLNLTRAHATTSAAHCSYTIRAYYIAAHCTLHLKAMQQRHDATQIISYTLQEMLSRGKIVSIARQY
jgi:hypothetical protein